MSEQWTKFYVDERQPGVVRGGPFDELGGMLVGVHADEICKRLNGYSTLITELREIVDWLEKEGQEPTSTDEGKCINGAYQMCAYKLTALLEKHEPENQI